MVLILALCYTELRIRLDEEHERKALVNTIVYYALTPLAWQPVYEVRRPTETPANPFEEREDWCGTHLHTSIARVVEIEEFIGRNTRYSDSWQAADQLYGKRENDTYQLTIHVDMPMLFERCHVDQPHDLFSTMTYCRTQPDIVACIQKTPEWWRNGYCDIDVDTFGHVHMSYTIDQRVRDCWHHDDFNKMLNDMHEVFYIKWKHSLPGGRCCGLNM
jgi:hypothetical protein